MTSGPEPAALELRARRIAIGYAKQVARHHHERWDGSGYPDGLAGDDIPLAARLMAVADVFDALISRRVYKAPMPWIEARDTMAAQRGRHFDPDLLDLFVDGFDEFCAIARLHPDEDPPAAPPASPDQGSASAWPGAS